MFMRFVYKIIISDDVINIVYGVIQHWEKLFHTLLYKIPHQNLILRCFSSMWLGRRRKRRGIQPWYIWVVGMTSCNCLAIFLSKRFFSEILVVIRLIVSFGSSSSTRRSIQKHATVDFTLMHEMSKKKKEEGIKSSRSFVLPLIHLPKREGKLEQRWRK